MLRCSLDGSIVISDVSHRTRSSANSMAQEGSVSISEASTSMMMMKRGGGGLIADPRCATFSSILMLCISFPGRFLGLAVFIHILYDFNAGFWDSLLS